MHDLPIVMAQGLAVLVGVLVVLKLVRRAVGRVDDDRTRDQLLFFLPKAAAAVSTVFGLAAIGIDVSGMAAMMATVGFTGAVVFTPVGQNLVAGTMIRIDNVYDDRSTGTARANRPSSPSTMSGRRRCSSRPTPGSRTAPRSRGSGASRRDAGVVNPG